MISMNKRYGFTLVELLVVIAMIVTIMGAMATSVSAAQRRARIQKATSDVNVITQAILAYENYAKGSYDNSGSYSIPTKLEGTIKNSHLCSKDTLDFLLGNKENAQSSGQIPALMMAALSGEGKLFDPWGNPYRVYIRTGQVDTSNVKSLTSINYALPNYYRLSEKERDL